jgi:hypothetical protein
MGSFSINNMLDTESVDNLESNDVLASATSNLPHGLSALRHREFRLLWFGTFASNVGSNFRDKQFGQQLGFFRSLYVRPPSLDALSTIEQVLLIVFR